MNIVVIGGGLAGASAVDELRSQAYTEGITMTGAEPPPAVRAAALVQGTAVGQRRPGLGLRPPQQVVRRPAG